MRKTTGSGEVYCPHTVMKNCKYKHRLKNLPHVMKLMIFFRIGDQPALLLQIWKA